MEEPLETIDETMETSFSHAFSDFQRQRALGTTRITRSQSAEGFQTPMQGDTPLHATIGTIAEEVAIQADRRAAAINPSFDDQPEEDEQPAAAQNDANPLNHMEVPKHMFEKISAFHFSLVEKNVITFSGSDHGQRWIRLKSIFEQIDLLTLFLSELGSNLLTIGSTTPTAIQRDTNLYSRIFHTLLAPTMSTNIHPTRASYLDSWLSVLMKPTDISRKMDSSNAMDS